jgi:Zn-dependent protease with chaperone function
VNNSNKYFLATVLSGVIVTLGFAGLAMRSYQPAYEAFLRFCGVAVETCQRIVENLSPLNIVALAGIVWLLAVFMWQIMRTRWILGPILSRRKDLPNYLESQSLRLGLANRVKLVLGNVLFCSGYLNPQVIIGRDILNSLSKRELEAALAHESYHVRNRDPLKVLLVTTFARAFFFIPAIGELSRSYLIQKEILADQFAANAVGKAYLSKALYKVLSGTKPQELRVFAGFADVRDLKTSSFSSWAAAVSVLLVLFILTSALKPAQALGVGSVC